MENGEWVILFELVYKEAGRHNNEGLEAAVWDGRCLQRTRVRGSTLIFDCYLKNKYEEEKGIVIPFELQFNREADLAHL